MPFARSRITILCGADVKFPLHLWDRLLPQATTSLNLLRNSRLNPRLSAKEHLNRTFDYSRTPMAPLGTGIILHEKPNQHHTWAPHSLDGWYTGYAPKHYRCYTVYVTATSATHITDTIEFFHNSVSCQKCPPPMPPSLQHRI